MLVDAHVHCIELGDDIQKYVNNGIVMACVSDDPSSARQLLELARKYRGIIPCVGVHPWVIHEYRVEDIVKLLEEAITKYNVKCLGEVGLDKRFKPETYSIQYNVFKLIVNYAREYSLILNLHTAGAWREVFNEVYGNDVERAYFHWYTGPLDLLDEITSVGYYIGINPALEIQAKHREVVERCDLKYMITESDAPYEYRGLKLMPELVKKTISQIASIKSVSEDHVEATIYANFTRLFKI